MLGFEAFARLSAFGGTADEYSSFVAEFLRAVAQFRIFLGSGQSKASQGRDDRLPRVHVAAALGSHLHAGIQCGDERVRIRRLQ